MKSKCTKWIKTITFGVNRDRHKEKYIRHKYFNDPNKRLLCQKCNATIIHSKISIKYCRYYFYGKTSEDSTTI